MDRLQQKSELMYKLGVLFGPPERLVSQPADYDDQERAEIIARYFAEYPTLAEEFRKFSESQPGHKYSIQHSQFYSSLYGVELGLTRSQDLKQLVLAALPEARAAIDAIPIPHTSVIMEAGTPFTTCGKLKSLCEVDTTKELVWVDAYMGPSYFHRYLEGIRKDAMVTLVTSEPGVRAGTTNRDRWQEFLDISKLYAQERGNAHYRLIVHSGLLHDRWLVFDTKRFYMLGGSAKDAGDKQYYTIAGLDASSQNTSALQQHINTGQEYFGPNTPTHLQF